MQNFDVAIIGAGPAGSATAIALARKGYSVALIDRAKFPRDKLCGDFINPANWPLFRELGIEKEILERSHSKISHFRISCLSGEQAEVPLPTMNGEIVYGLGLSRFWLDHLLLRKSLSAGATAFQGCKVKELKKDPHGWCLTLEDSAKRQNICARILVGADGRNSWVAERLGMTPGTPVEARCIGFQFRLGGSTVADRKVEIHLFRGGYAGLVALGNGTVNFCLAVDKNCFSQYGSLEGLLEFGLSLNPHLKKILRRSERLGRAESIYPVYFPPRRCYGDGALLVGDAAGVSEPVTGEGIYFALKGGMLAAKTVGQALATNSVSAESLRPYDHQRRLAFRSRRTINSWIRFLVYRPALAAPLVRLSAKGTRLIDALVYRVCQPETA